MRKRGKKTVRNRCPIAKDLRTPKYKMRVVRDRKKSDNKREARYKDIDQWEM